MNPTNNISLILLTKNESENIINNFNWLCQVPRITEIIVVDDSSTDTTLSELQKLDSNNLKIITHTRALDNDFSSQRQFAVDQASNNWILWLDADETPTQELIAFLNNFNTASSSDYAFKRQDIFLNQSLNHGETADQYFVRLFNKTSGKFVGKVHEVWCGVYPVSRQNISIIHNSHKTLRSFLTKINFYTTLRSQELYDQHVKTSLFEIIFYPIGKFFQDYIFKLGFLDSTPGIIMALSMSFHSFLVRAKLWHLWQQA